MSKTPKKVTFIANKKTTEPQVVRFSTKDGMVSFTAKTKVDRPQVVSFSVKPNKKKR